jgi:muramoyltetrapeptide carboxypeptidase
VVRVVAPASPFDPAALEAGIEVVREWGFEVRTRDDIHQRRAYFAGSPQRRAGELREAFTDPEAAAILAARGGYGLTSVVPLLDPDEIAANPKIVVGCSDLTVLLDFLVGHAGVTAIHGPMVIGLGRRDDPGGTERLRALLTSADKPAPLQSALGDAHRWCVSPGVARGRAVGGSLSLLAATCGTPWQVQTAGAVLFLEDVAERPYRIDRLLVQLEQAGLFADVAGVVLGDMVGCDEADGSIGWRDAVDRIFRRLSIPVLAGIPFGHGQPNLAIPLGVDVEVDAGAGLVRFRESPLSERSAT